MAIELQTKMLRLLYITRPEINICYFVTYLWIYQLEILDENGAKASHTCYSQARRAD